MTSVRNSFCSLHGSQRALSLRVKRVQAPSTNPFQAARSTERASKSHNYFLSNLLGRIEKEHVVTGKGCARGRVKSLLTCCNSCRNVLRLSRTVRDDVDGGPVRRHIVQIVGFGCSFIRYAVQFIRGDSIAFFAGCRESRSGAKRTEQLI
jgi:hypothetical protein